MKPVLALLTLASLHACAGSGKPVTSDSRPTREEIYEFTASILGTVVRGKLHVLTDTVLIDSEAGDCGTVTGDSRFIRVGCRSTTVVTTDQSFRMSGAVLSFDRGNPGQGAKWVGNFPVQKRRQVCERYETRQGREVCASTRIESYEELEPRSGPVQVRRLL
jgi:hypothetical protein